MSKTKSNYQLSSATLAMIALVNNAEFLARYGTGRHQRLAKHLINRSITPRRVSGFGAYMSNMMSFGRPAVQRIEKLAAA